MTHKYLLSSVALAMLPLAASALPTDFYAPSSRLAEGNWVRVGVQETGVYEITYDQLREMGFANPSLVAVFGGGGRQLPETFTDADGNPLIPTDLQEVKVTHKDNKLLFYGLGIEDIRFVEDSSLEMGGSFQKYSLNIYSNHGYYFLTDTLTPISMSVSEATSNNFSRVLKTGASYVYHEKDLVQNNWSVGQLFWGEHMVGDNLLRTWDVDLHDLADGKSGAMECKLYTLKNLNAGYAEEDQIFFGYGVGNSIKEGTAAAHYPLQSQTNTSDYIPQEPSLAGFTIPAGTDKVFVQIEDGHEVTGNFNMPALDYWVLSYTRNIPTLKDSKGNNISQDLIAFPTLTFPGTATFEVSDPHTKCAWDVTDPTNPIELPITITGDKGVVVVERFDRTPVVTIFDKMATLKRISGFENGWERIENQNIHSLRAEGCDMAIITIPRLYEGAMKIADLHEREYGDKVIVVNAQDVYNEFSGGVPDPMAYRSMVKMLYTTPTGRQIKNLLLAGPLVADFRGMNLPVDPERGLIAFQSHELNLETQSMNANDFYGMMGDYFNVFTIEKQTQHVGVGVLPLLSIEEFDRYTKKLEKFMTDKSFAYRLTSMLNIGGVGDNHIHDQQSVDISKYYNNVLGNSALNTVLALDAYGYEQSRNKWFETFNNGRHLATYFGHGGPTMLGQNQLFFTSSYINQFKNEPLPFMIFLGCTISNSDRGIRGLGESMVFDTDHGLIGTLLATRSTWSGQNYDFAKLVLSSFYYTNPNSLGSSLLTKPLTLGEVILKAKNASLFANEMAYQLLADPGLIIPVALQKINIITPASVSPGQTVKLSGSVSKIGSTAVDTDFNGEIVVRLLEPEFTMISEDLASPKPNSTSLKVSYSDEQMSMSVGKVENGRFEIEMYVPLQMAEHEGRKMSLNFCAYNPKTRTGASIAKNSEIKSASQTERPTPDLTAPTIEEFAYDHETNSITVIARDDVALDLSRNMLLGGFQVYIDGDYTREGSASQPELFENGPRAYKRTFNLGSLASGQHSARVLVKDASGNKTESEITFTISPNSGKYVLAMRENGLHNSGTFYVDGNAPESATLYITTGDGTEVISFNYKAGVEIVWDGKDAAGNRVAPGRYRAFLRETGSHQSKGHSDPIIIPVI